VEERATTAPLGLKGRYRLRMCAFARLGTSQAGRWSIAAVSAVSMVVLVVLAARHFATTSWPFSSGHPAVLVAAALLLLVAQALKSFGWARLFAREERPPVLALAAGNGGAALIGVVLPGRFDEVMRIAVVRRYPGCPAGVRVLAFSLLILGLIDSVALAPLALLAVVFPNGGMAVRAGLGVVVVGGIGAAVVIATLPRLAASRRATRLRLGRWLNSRTTSLRSASEAWALVSACWIVRASVVFLLLGTLGVGFSFPLALLYLCAGAAAAAVPIGPAGTATQVGAGATALIASGVEASQALGAAVSIAALGVLSGAAIMIVAIAWPAGILLARTVPPGLRGLRLAPSRG
jgi:uncharacterized membrane protein YbhN (UPF0104 family)